MRLSGVIGAADERSPSGRLKARQTKSEREEIRLKNYVLGEKIRVSSG
jgi:hypothetical protein